MNRTFEMRPSTFSTLYKFWAVFFSILLATFINPFFKCYADATQPAETIIEEKPPVERIYFVKIVPDETVPKIKSISTIQSEIEDMLDVDPLSMIDDSNYDEKLEEGIDAIYKYVDLLEVNVPFTVNKNKHYLSDLARKILEKVIYEEARLCPFEQQAAIAGLILNRMDAEEFPSDMFEMVTAPYQFRESYGYAPFPELNYRSKMAVQCALDGIDFSCGAVAYYNPEYSSSTGIEYFESSTTVTTQIKDNMNLLLCCLNEHKEETLSLNKYVYSREFGTVIKY